jgi:DTW domain
MAAPCSDAEEHLLGFLNECRAEVARHRSEREDGADFARITCATCHASRSLFCADCARLLLPPEQWPQHIREGHLFLPFDVDIILNDRRLSATGVHLYTIFQSMERYCGSPVKQRSTNCRLFDIDRGEEIPNYTDFEKDETFVLFPGPTSQPLSSVVDCNGISRVKRLVVLDCKWSSSSVRLHPSLVALPQVHLDGGLPKHSYFWRWHNAGDNMLSTIEAIYYCAWEIAATRPDIPKSDRESMVQILWLFGLIREIIQSRYDEGRVQSFIHPPSVPFLESSKEYYRLLRKQHRRSKKVQVSQSES